MATLVHSQREVWKSQSENTPVLLAMMIIIRLNPVVRDKVICHCHLETQSRDICAAAVCWLCRSLLAQLCAELLCNLI